MAEWLLELPQYLAQGLNWLTTPFYLGSLQITPLSIFGASFGAFIAVLLVLKVKNLII